MVTLFGGVLTLYRCKHDSFDINVSGVAETKGPLWLQGLYNFSHHLKCTQLSVLQFYLKVGKKEEGNDNNNPMKKL